MPIAEVGANKIEYGDVGSGPTVVFVHGVFMNGTVWDDVVGRLSARFRCITPTLPLGGHSEPVAPGTDLRPRAIAALIPAFLESAQLRDVTLVANDTGAGLTLIALASEHPGLKRVTRLVLTNGDNYEKFPPKAMRPLVTLARRVPFLTSPLMGFTMRKERIRLSYIRSVCGTEVSLNRIGPWFDRLKNVGVRRDAVRAIGRIHRSATLGAAHAIAAFDRPVLLAWGADDDFFPIADAQRLAAAFPNADVVEIPKSKTYVMLDAPDQLAQLIADFAAAAGSPS